MTEHRDPYESGPAPAPAATCPTCGGPCTEDVEVTTEAVHYPNGLVLPGTRKVYRSSWSTDEWRLEAGKWVIKAATAEMKCKELEAKLAALPTPDPAPLTALEREALEAGIEHDGAMQMVPIADQDGDRETRHVAREYVKETKRTLRKAVDALQAARAAVGREGAG